MYHPTTRVLTVLELLQSRARITGPELAERLEVDGRTVRRYIGMLQELGIPVESLRGRYGAYRLRPGYKLPPMMFAEDEALALVLGLLAARRMGVTQAAPATDGALAKILRVLPLALRERVRAVESSLVMAAEPPEPPAAEGSLIILLSAASRQNRRVWLRHRAYTGEESERLVDPYELVYRAGRWYLAGYCHLRQDIRTFRLDRILRAELRDETFERPANFDGLAQVERSIAQTPGPVRVEALLQMTLAEAQDRVPASLATLEETPQGILLRCQMQDLTWIAPFLAGLGCPFTVIQPDALRDELRTLAERALRAAGVEEAVGV
jgi:predicted DNA-binding transcriptional regulator YafY